MAFLINFLINEIKCNFRGSKESGGLVAIDPVSDTAVIVNIDDQDASKNDISDVPVTLVPFVDWKTLTVLDESDEVKDRVKKFIKKNSFKQHNLSSEEIIARREGVVEHLSKYGLKPELDGDNIVIGDTVIIQPPFTEDFCDATNEIILGRVKSILQNIK